MKKNKRHLYKRLPKYALGTMKPMDMGYQQARGIGNVKFDTELNTSLEPETQAIRKSALPNAIGYIGQQTPYITEMLKSLNNATSSTTSATTNTFSPSPTMYSLQGSPIINGLNTTMLSQVAPKIATVSGLAPVSDLGRLLAATTGGKLLTGGEMLATNGAGSLSASSGGGLSTGAANTAKGAAGAGTSALGTALGAVGTAIGGYTMANQIAGFGDHRSGSDMFANVGRQHITTDRGNSYTNYNGVNMAQEVALENANTRAKQLGFGMNAIGTGASLGGLLASTGALGSIGGPLGTAIGAGVGLLVGGLGSLFGWGDNEEEVRRQVSMTNDNIAMYNRQQEAVAKSKDVASEFSDRQGVSAAATGKGAYLSMDKFLPMFKNKTHGKDVEVLQGSDGPKIGIATSMGEKGEGAYNFETRQGSIIEGFEKGKGDAQPLYHTDGDSTVIFSKKLGFADIANPYILDTLRNWNIINNMKGDAQTLKVLKAVATAKIEKNDMKLREINNALSAFKQQMEMKKYKNGKLPGFWRGTDYLMSAIPHLAALGSSWNLYNRAKYADTHAPSTYVSNAAGAQALNELAQLRFDPTQYLTDARRAYNQANFQANRMAGLGAGGQAILRNTNYLNYLDSLGKIRIAQQDADNKYRTAHASALAEYGAREQEALINDNIRRFQWQQQQNAAKEGWMAQYEKNGLTALADLASDIMGVRQFNRSEDYLNRMLKLYNQQVENDKVKAQAALDNANANRSRYDKQYNSSVADLIKTYNTINSLYNPTINPLNVLRMIR